MSNPILIKRSAVTTKVPLTTDLSLGELAINTFDGKLFTKKNNGSDVMVEIGPVYAVAGRTGSVALVVADISGAAPLANPVFTGSVTAPVFNGAGTGLTGIASGLNIGGNAATATYSNAVIQNTDPIAATYRLLLGNATNTSGPAYNKSNLYWNDNGSIIQGANISGNAANVTGVVAIVNGGTGATTAITALSNIGALGTLNNALGGGIDLNTLTTTGLYYQNSDANAAAGTNYPAPYAGKLTVTNSNNSIGLWQEYTMHNISGTSNRKFHRQYYASLWSVWAEEVVATQVPLVNPATPKDGDVQVLAGPIISIYATGAWRQIFPAVYA
jgi:hypothetical protein